MAEREIKILKGQVRRERQVKYTGRPKRYLEGSDDDFLQYDSEEEEVCPSICISCHINTILKVLY